jgi:hypothetical protein
MHPQGMRDASQIPMTAKEKEAKEEKSVQPTVATEQAKAALTPREEARGGEAVAREVSRMRTEPRAEGGMRSAGLDQLREILFGAIYRDFDRRLARADAQLAARASELQQEHRKRTEVLEMHVRRDIEALAIRVERKYAETGEALRSLTRESRDAIAALLQRVAKVEESITGAQRELRQELLEQAKSFLDEMQRMRRELLATLERELGVAESEEAEELGHDGHAERHTT